MVHQELRTTKFPATPFRRLAPKAAQHCLTQMNSVKQTNEPRPNQIAVFCDRHSKLPAKLCSKCRDKCPPFVLTRACTDA